MPNIAYPDLVRFGKGCTYQLYAIIGDYDLNLARPCLTSTDRQTPLQRQEGHGLSPDRSWITRDRENILWLPLEYWLAILIVFLTPVTKAVAIACRTDHVKFLNLSNEKLNNMMPN